MIRWGIAAFCWIGFLVGLIAVSTVANSAKRSAAGDRDAVSVYAANDVRPHRVRAKLRHADSKLRHVDRSRVSHHKVRPRVSAQTQRLRVFSAGRPVYRLGKPYVISGRTYTPRLDPNYRAEGKASWYGGDFHGRLTANGEKFDMNALSAAHPTLPLPSYVRVTNLQNKRTLVVRVNDRGPYRGNRLIDVSVRAAEILGFHDQGIAQVRVEYIGLAERAGPDNTKIASSLRR